MSITIIPDSLQKKTHEEIEKSIYHFSSIIPQSLITRTLPCYSGYQGPVDYRKMRPVGLIGPLEHEILPDSPIRKVIWLSHVLFQEKQAQDFLSTLPGMEIIKKVNSPEFIYFSDTDTALKKNCFDEALQDNPAYQLATKTRAAYRRMRSLAFELRSPRLLLNVLRYREVANAAIGDLVIYFSNAVVSPKDDFLDYSPYRKMSHYGRVVAITKDKTLIVESRFNFSHVFRHPIDCIPYFFGNSYLIFTKI